MNEAIPKPTSKPKNQGQKKWLFFRKVYLKTQYQDWRGYFQCAICRNWLANPEVDHIQKRGSHPELVYEMENLRTLCSPCHRRVT